MKKINLSVVIPVYNEEKALEKTIKDIITNIKKSAVDQFELIAVNDASKDNSFKILKKISRLNKKIKLLSHKTNRGYGAALKTGIKNSKFDWVLITDADGTYPAGSIHTLVKWTVESDMVVGARIKKGAKIQPIRIIPKKIVQLVANFLTGEKIPDINSGLRIFRKEIAQEFWHLLPDKFSFTTTITLSSHLKKYYVKYIPINYFKRVGKSSIKPYDFVYFLTLIIRLITYFNPLKFFFWPGILFGVTGLLWISFTLIKYRNITDSGILLLITGIQISFFGLIADLIVKTRESNEKK